MHSLRHLLSLLLLSVGLTLVLSSCGSWNPAVGFSGANTLNEIPPRIPRAQLIELLNSRGIVATSSEFFTEPDGTLIETLIFQYHKKEADFYIGYDQVLLILKDSILVEKRHTFVPATFPQRIEKIQQVVQKSPESSNNNASTTQQ